MEEVTDKRPFEVINIVLLCLSGIFLVGLQQKPWAWLLVATGILELFLCRRQFAKDVLLIYLSLALLGITPITTDISYQHMAFMGATLVLAIAIPYAVSRFIYKDYLVRFQFHNNRGWYKKEILYIAVTAAICYFIIPFYLRDTAAYLNWTVEPGISHISRFFIGTNALGIWDELFFISTVLGILRRFLPFIWANLAQSVLFTSFLYELGFTGWGFAMIFVFANIQGFVFKKTESLLYVITIHLTMDFILFLALINAHHTGWMNIFVT